MDILRIDFSQLRFPRYWKKLYYLIRLMVDEPAEIEDAPYDNEDLTDSLKEALREVMAHRRGEIELPDAREFLNSLGEMKP